MQATFTSGGSDMDGRGGISGGMKFMPSRSRFLTQVSVASAPDGQAGKPPHCPAREGELIVVDCQGILSTKDGDAVAYVPAGCNRMPLTILVILLLRKW